MGLTVADGSVLPRVSRVNPALTIYAWALRAAERLAARLQREAEHGEPRPALEQRRAAVLS
jgi:choline dehydrogenase-like flavoprotein